MLSRHQDFGRCNLCAELEGRDGKTLELMYHIPKRLAPKITGAVAARDLSRRALELFPDRIYISDPSPSPSTQNIRNYLCLRVSRVIQSFS